MHIVANASPLILLTKVGQLGLLPAIASRVDVPRAVARVDVRHPHHDPGQDRAHQRAGEQAGATDDLTRDVLIGEVDRMLADPKSRRFVVNFTDQWLKLRDIDFTVPDQRLYPEYSQLLRQSMLGSSVSIWS